MILLLLVLCGQPDAPTPMKQCEKAVSILLLTKDDVFYDLGCGDGRIVSMAAMKTGCRAVGIDYDEKRVKLARQTVKQNKVDHLVKIYHADLREVDFEKLPATVFYLYLPQKLIKELTPKLQKCQGVVIISYIHPLPIDHGRKEGDFFIYKILKGEKK